MHVGGVFISLSGTDWLTRGRGVADVKQRGDVKCSFYLILFDCFYSACWRLTIQSHKGIWKENKRDEMKHVKGSFKESFEMIKRHENEGKLE